MIIGERLKELRLQHGLTQEQLGEYLGLTKCAISLYESEKRNPSLENIIELMYLFGVSADYLLGADSIVEIKNEESPKYRTLTKEELLFIEGIRKDKLLSEILLFDHKRGIEIIKARIG